MLDKSALSSRGFAQLLDKLALPALLTGADHLVHHANSPATQDFGISIGDFFHQGALPAALELIEAERQTDNDARFLATARVGDRDVLYDFSGTPLTDGSCLWVGQVAPDARTSLQTLIEQSRQHGGHADNHMRFIATMSHEMRTPLNGILGMTKLLEDSGLDSNQQTYASAVRQSGEALLSLINDILDFAKIDADHVSLQADWFDPVALVQSVCELLAPRAEAKGVEITALVDDAVPARIHGDEGRIRQVLLNIAGNGVKFTESGGVRLDVRWQKDAQHGSDALVFTVTDTGIGINQTDIDRIFGAFQQAQDPRARRSEGTGLGLSIAQRLVSAMGGTIDVESDVGRGSRFTFDVTITAPATDMPELAPTPREFPETAIVLSANEVLGDTLAAQLSQLGVRQVESHANLPEAIAAAQSRPHTPVLIDTDFADQWANHIGDFPHRSIILLPTTRRSALDAFMAKGFSGYLMKPIRLQSLSEQLMHHTDNKVDFIEPVSPIQPAAEAPVEEKPASQRILLAEDNQINVVLATAILRRAGYAVDVASTGLEAIERFSEGDYALILMDMRMPELDGIEATRRLRNMGYLDHPIVALTANAMSADREACLAAGMNDFISKPFEPEHLTAVVDKWVDSTVQIQHAG